MTIFEILEKLNIILEKLDDIYHYLRGEELRRKEPPNESHSE